MGITRLLLCLLFSLFMLQRSTYAEKKSYIVYFGGHSHDWNLASVDLQRVTDSHYDFLGQFLGSKEKAKDAILYSYTRHINGFAANLDEEEALEISKRPGVISIFPNRGRKLHTTRSWEFMGLEKNGTVLAESIWAKARFGEDVIIANIDTGVWPESKSFSDEGMGPVPSKWKGICENNTKAGVSCNKKLIGARYFNKGYQSFTGPLADPEQNSPRDFEGHGTHTLSIAGGGFVPGASIFGLATGTAKGGSPGARVASYKVCWKPINGSQCFDSDILAAFDQAIYDGVDIISVSLGGEASFYLEDSIAIGAFHAVKKGVTVVCSAGNDGPYPYTVANVAPWIITVGASSLDREFNSFATLGNKKHLKGASLSGIGLPKEKFYPLVDSADLKAANETVPDAQFCFLGSLDPRKAMGKIVVCLRGFNSRVEKGQAVAAAGGVGMILANDEASANEIIADSHVLPATHLTFTDGAAVYSYINSTKSPMAFLTRPVAQLNIKPAPVMAAFSSQGPNYVTPEILKPDITAPGVNVIAAFSEAASITGIASDNRRSPFNVESGTSMSCPHISGVAGLIKTVHPDWSPSAIRSAIMTTARRQDTAGEPIRDSSFTKATPFSYGAGHVRPNRAMDPGLIYDLTVDDYLNLLCSIYFLESDIAAIANQSYTCPTKKMEITDFNYPSITVPQLLDDTVTVTRTVKNVGPPATYTARIQHPAGVRVSVEPDTLKFEKIGEEKKFKVNITADESFGIDYAFGMLIWSDGKHYVRSPIVVSRWTIL